MKIAKSLNNTIQKIFEESNQKKYYEHSLRVYGYVKKLSQSENGNLKILEPASLLHDIGMTIDPTFQGHPIQSAKMSVPILENLKFSSIEIQSINEVILSHHPEPGTDLDSIEKRILFDADNLDLIGPFGILRWIGSFPPKASSLKSSLSFFLDIVEKCEHSRGSLFYTKTAKEQSIELMNFTKEYCKNVISHIEPFETSLIPKEFPKLTHHE